MQVVVVFNLAVDGTANWLLLPISFSSFSGLKTEEKGFF